MDSESGKKLHITTVDYEGRTITCTERQWKNHICRKPHEYMYGEEQEVIDALEKPDYGIRHLDTEDPTHRRVYYMTHHSKGCWVKVIVEFRDDECAGAGEIITAFETNNIKDGEKPELPK